MQKLSFAVIMGIASIGTAMGANITPAASIAKMGSENVAKLALYRQIGSCILTTGVGTTWKYRLSHYDSGKIKYKYYGGLQALPQTFPMQLQAAPMQQSVSTEKKRSESIMAWLKNFIISDAHAAQVYAMPVYQLASFSVIERQSILGQAGSYIKSLVAQSKCGTIAPFEKFTSDISKMETVQFFRDAQGNLKCSEQSLNKMVRAPGGCNLIPVRSELDPRICRTIYQMKTAADKSQRVPKPSDSGNGSAGPKGSGVIGVAAGALVKFADFTPAIQKDFALSKALDQDFELAPLTMAAEYATVSDSLPIAVQEFLDDKGQDLTAASFAALSTQEKAMAVSVLATINAVQANASDFAALGPKVSKFSNAAVKTAITSYAQANPGLEVAYAVPTKALVSDAFATALSPVKTVLGVPYSLNLNCLEAAIMQAAPAKAQMAVQ